MNPKQWALVGYLVLSGLITIWRGATGSHRRYEPLDAVLAPLEIGVLIWLVATL